MLVTPAGAVKLYVPFEVYIQVPAIQFCVVKAAVLTLTELVHKGVDENAIAVIMYDITWTDSI